MWTERARRSAEAQGTVQSPGPAADAESAAQLFYTVEPARFIRVSTELAVVAWTWSMLAVTETVALVVLQGGSLRHWEWALGFGLPYGVVQWLIVHRLTFARPILAAPPEAVVAPPARLIWAALGGAAVLAAVIVAIVLVSDIEDARLLIALQIGAAVGAGATSVVAYGRVRAIEQRTSATILRLQLRRLRVDGHKATRAERKVVSKARFSTEPSES